MTRGGKKFKTQGQRRAEKEKDKILDQLDELAAFEDFKNNILPVLMQDIQSGLEAPALRQKYKNILQAMQITTALTAQDPRVRDQIINKIIDREEGTAVSRKEETHKYEDLTDKDVDAILLTKLKEAGVDLDITDEDESENETKH